MDLGQTSRVYTKEFNEETVQLVLQRGMSISQFFKDFDIGSDLIYS